MTLDLDEVRILRRCAGGGSCRSVSPRRRPSPAPPRRGARPPARRSTRIPSRPAAGRTTWRRRATAASGTRRRDRAARLARPGTGGRGTSRSATGLGAARRDRRPGRGAVDHRRRAERDRAGGPATRRCAASRCPPTGYANLNTAVFDRRGMLWFTGQSGIYGRLDPGREGAGLRGAARSGPYGITARPGEVYYARSPAATSAGSTSRAHGG